MRITIERLRSMVLGTGALLIAALIAFLAVGRWRSHINIREIPKHLGVDIKQEANGVTYTQAHGGHTIFKIHASKVVELRKDGRALLHDVQIELYGKDGKSIDRIAGNEFEYDQKAGTAAATGPVEITITRPAATARPDTSTPKTKASPLSNMAHNAVQGEINVKTSGLVFDQRSGIATTSHRVEFSTLQGTGSSEGATFDSDSGKLILDRAVELHVQRAGEPVALTAAHAEFDRGALECQLKAASASYRQGGATAGEARIVFREDGSAVSLDALDGLKLSSASGVHITAPTGHLEFNEQNQPRSARLQGGVTLASESDNRTVHGSSPSAVLSFSARGELTHAHLERGVEMRSEEMLQGTGKSSGVRETREWKSPVADIDLRSSRKGRLELASIQGAGGVTLSGTSQRGSGPVSPTKMSADGVVATFGPEQQIQQMVGTGHARLEQTTASGSHQTTNGDRLEVHFRGAGAGGAAGAGKGDQAAAIESATVDGNVVLTQAPALRGGRAGEPALRATAGRAVYEGTGEWLHLTVNPRVDTGELALSADRLDVSQETGDAFAHGDVKATWLGSTAQGTAHAAQAGFALGGEAPAHVVAGDAQIHQATGEATFRGHARLWQQANSISAPVIVLNRTRQTVIAHGDGAADPVHLVLLNGSHGGADGKKAGEPAVVRVRAGDVAYSAAERLVKLRAGATDAVVAETGAATVASQQVDLVLLPPGNHPEGPGREAQVDRLTARGRVSVSSQGRRGTGEQLVYSSETGEYTLTGTSVNPPELIDPAHGTIRGEALIFNTRDDSVSIEGQGHKTRTETVAPR